MGDQDGSGRGGTGTGWEARQAGPSVFDAAEGVPRAGPGSWGAAPESLAGEDPPGGWDVVPAPASGGAAAGGVPDAGWREVAPGVLARADSPDRLLRGGGVSGPRGASPESSGRAGRWNRGGGTSRLAGRRGLWALAAAVFVVVMGVGVVQRGPTGASVAASPTSGSSPGSVAAAGGAGATESTAPRSDEGSGSTAERPGPASASAVPSGSPSAQLEGDVDWWGVLAELDARRSAALESLDLAALDSYAVVDSPAWQADAALVTDLQRRELRPAGLSTQLIAIEEVTPIDAEGDGRGAAVELVIVDRRGAYTMVDASGDTIQTVRAAGSRRWRMLVERARDQAAQQEAARAGESDADSGWLVRSVEAVT